MKQRKWKSVMGQLLAVTMFAALILAVPPVTSSMAIASEAEEKAPEEYEGTFVIWLWGGFVDLFERFNKVYPNIEPTYVDVASNDYVQKLQTALAAGTELPDFGQADIGWRGRAFALDIWEDLEADPYNVNQEDIVKATWGGLRNKDGVLVNVQDSITAAGIAYKRDLAKEYFGTDDPDELAAIFQTWDDFITKGQEVKEKSNGEVYMFATLDDIATYYQNRIATSFVVDGKYDVAEETKTIFEEVVKFRDSGVVDNIAMWTPTWNASFADKEHIFFLCATWIPSYTIEPNDPDGSGNWGIMKCPEKSISWGGTGRGIIKQGQNKENAWAFLKWGYLSEEGGYQLQESQGNLTTYKPFYDNDPNAAVNVSEYFGGQDIGSFWYNTVIPDVDTRPVDEYDSAIIDTITYVTAALYADDSLDADAAYEMFVEEMHNRVPDVEID